MENKKTYSYFCSDWNFWSELFEAEGWSWIPFTWQKLIKLWDDRTDEAHIASSWTTLSAMWATNQLCVSWMWYLKRRGTWPPPLFLWTLTCLWERWFPGKLPNNSGRRSRTRLCHSQVKASKPPTHFIAGSVSTGRRVLGLTTMCSIVVSYRRYRGLLRLIIASDERKT